ncbi:MAG: hypothetical protein KDI50_01880, partial [Candidatus Competibacteraceae bacterium]|nr:hypothetical protein [Candidatus Competibacteraceae bacterium]
MNSLDAALRMHIRPNVGLWDPELNAVTPLDHYGQLSTALALLLLDEQGGGGWRQPLDAWLALGNGSLGHLPFNRFLLLLLRDVLIRRGAHEEDLGRITQGLARCNLKKRYPSNNWSLLAQLCRVIEAIPAQRSAQMKRFCRLLDRWMTPAGGFIDFPAHPQRGGATPMTYHHKALFLAMTAAWFQDDVALTPRIQRLLEWVDLCWDGGGYVGGFGRSTHALFGDGCLLASLTLLGLAGGREDRSGWPVMMDGILRRLQSQRREDGFYGLNPARVEGRCGWDGYMALSVYNAWFAAVLAWARTITTVRPIPRCLETVSLSRLPVDSTGNERGQAALIHDDRAGLLKLATESGLTVLFSTRGQPPQAFSQHEMEFRYSGGVPFHVRVGNEVVVPPPIRVGRETLVCHPVLAGWTPVFLVDERYFGLTDFTQAAVEESEDAYYIQLQGHPSALCRRPVEGGWPRLRAALDWRLLGGVWGRQEALRRERCEALWGMIKVRIDRRRLEVLVEVWVENKLGVAAVYLNPAGHVLTDHARACMKEWRQQPEGCQAAGLNPATDHGDEWVVMPILSALAPAKAFCHAPVVWSAGSVGYSLR